LAVGPHIYSNRSVYISIHRYRHTDSNKHMQMNTHICEYSHIICMKVHVIIYKQMYLCTNISRCIDKYTYIDLCKYTYIDLCTAYRIWTVIQSYNLQSQSHGPLFNGTWQKRPRDRPRMEESHSDQPRTTGM